MGRRRRPRLRLTASARSGKQRRKFGILIFVGMDNRSAVQGGLGVQRLGIGSMIRARGEAAEGLGTSGVFTDGGRRKALGRWHRRSIHSEMIITTTQVVMLTKNGCSRKARDEEMLRSILVRLGGSSTTTCGRRCKGRRAAVTSHARDRPKGSVLDSRRV